MRDDLTDERRRTTDEKRQTTVVLVSALEGLGAVQIPFSVADWHWRKVK